MPLCTPFRLLWSTVNPRCQIHLSLEYVSPLQAPMLGGDMQGASESRVAPEGLEDSKAITQATPRCPARLCPTGHFGIGSAPLQRPNGFVPQGIGGNAVVRAQMRASGLLQLKLLTHCVVLVKQFSLPVPLFTHPSSDENGPLRCAGTC